MNGRFPLSAVVAVSTCFGWSCAEVDHEPQVGRLVATGEHIQIWASPSIDVCGGNLDYLDRFVDELRATVGPHPAAEDLRRYYVLDDADWETTQQAINCRGAACTTAFRTIYASGISPLVHEVTHGELFTNGHRFFEEGLAMVYGDAYHGSPFGTSVLDGLRNEWVVPEAYPRAGHFVGFLIDRYGVETFLAMKDASSSGMSFESLPELFEEELGESLGTVLAAYSAFEQAELECNTSEYREALVECAAETTPWDATATLWETETDLNCDDDDVLGPSYGHQFVVRSFTVEDLSLLRFELEGSGAFARVYECNNTCQSYPIREPGQPALEVTSDDPPQEWFTPGHYWVGIYRRADADPQTIRLLIRRRA